MAADVAHVDRGPYGGAQGPQTAAPGPWASDPRSPWTFQTNVTVFLAKSLVYRMVPLRMKPVVSLLVLDLSDAEVQASEGPLRTLTMVSRFCDISLIPSESYQVLVMNLLALLCPIFIVARSGKFLFH